MYLYRNKVTQVIPLPSRYRNALDGQKEYNAIFHTANVHHVLKCVQALERNDDFFLLTLLNESVRKNDLSTLIELYQALCRLAMTRKGPVSPMCEDYGLHHHFIGLGSRNVWVEIYQTLERMALSFHGPVCSLHNQCLLFLEQDLNIFQNKF